MPSVRQTTIKEIKFAAMNCGSAGSLSGYGFGSTYRCYVNNRMGIFGTDYLVRVLSCPSVSIVASGGGQWKRGSIIRMRFVSSRVAKRRCPSDTSCNLRR